MPGRLSFNFLHAVENVLCESKLVFSFLTPEVVLVDVYVGG